MYLRQLIASLCALQVARAALNASPLLVYSTDRSTWPSIKSQQLALATNVQDILLQGDCPPTDLVIIHQTQISVEQIQHMHLLRERIRSNSNGTVMQIPRLVGQLDTEQIKLQMSAHCSKAKINIHRIEAHGGTDQTLESVAAAADSEVQELLAGRSQPYTLLLTAGSCTSDQEHEPYTMDEPLLIAHHSDLRRDLRADASLEVTAKDNAGKTASLPLFESYQFLSPALFMGFGVSLLLLLILYVALSAISGLEVSYKAFSKDMGPQAQKTK